MKTILTNKVLGEVYFIISLLVVKNEEMKK